MIELNNLTSTKVDEKFFKKVVREILNEEENSSFDVSIAIIGKDKIHSLNKKYRKKDKPTDVLSFQYGAGSGEIAICPEIVEEKSKKSRFSLEKEMARRLIHGTLHLLGYDHERGEAEAQKMQKKEELYFKELVV